MKKRLSPKDESTLRALRDRMLLTIQFIESVEDFPSGVQMRSLVEHAAAKADLRTLRLLAGEVNQMTIALRSDQREGLEAVLHQKLGVDRDQERAELKHEVAKVIQRGRIVSEKERRRLEDYAEMLEATGGDPMELAAVRRLVQSA